MIKKEGFYGIINIPRENVLAVLNQEIKYHIPGNVRIRTIREDYFRDSLAIVLESEERVPNVTYEVKEGQVIPDSQVEFSRINNNNKQ
ncbi:hypothetical protein ACH2FV_19295 (plasmid) [Bacillus safensis subsp. safensis]|uniref:hypothetical protein n=1 Tax=Bacillus safensis TaxID=561879 RepID=UPI0037C0AEF7